MTREEAIKHIENIKPFVGGNVKEAINLAIKALEQEPVLDKIRAEINTMPCAITSMREIYVNRDNVINIIDKYKAENEESYSE